MDENILIEFIKSGLLIANSSISTIVGAVITTLFLRKNTSTTEFEKVKAGKFDEVIDRLLNSGSMSYLEYNKCKNYLNIAKKADMQLTEINNFTNSTNSQYNKYDFDWFIRFFEAAGNISNEEMQILWASVLAGEVNNSGSFSLRTLDTLYNLTRYEAELFANISKIILDDSILFSSMGDVGQEINERYGFDNDALRLLEECGLINGLKMQSRLELLPGESGGFTCGNMLLLFTCIHDEGIIVDYICYNLTTVGRQLYSVIPSCSDATYLRELGTIIQEKYTYLKVSMHPMTEDDGNCISYDSNIDLLNKY